jgi:hypothetical protein
MKLLASVSGQGNMSYAWVGVQSANTISFSNDGVEDAVVVVHGISITIKAGEILQEISFPVKILDIGITTNSAWRLLIGD